MEQNLMYYLIFIQISLVECEELQSLLLPRQLEWAIEGRKSESVCDKILKFKSLRMLDLHNSGIKVLPDSIGELKDPRYLDLSPNVSIKALPNSICKHLQTLKLKYCLVRRT